MKKLTAAIILTAIITSLLTTPARAVTASPLVTVTFGKNTKIYGFSAQDVLGKKTGTLEEFAKAITNDKTESILLFPANYFNAYEDTREIFGGIYSQGELVHDDWFNWGCGFDESNKLHLFSLISTMTNMGLDRIVVKDQNGNDIELITAFNCYPWLIKDGENLEIAPFPGADENFLNTKRQRAFMGQKSDGTFMYGMVGNATIRELQELCASLGLVTAVNTDGGASAGVYQNGKYLAKSGRELASVLCIMEEETPEPDTPSVWAAEAVERAVSLDLVSDSLNCAYTTAATRAEFCSLAVRLYESKTGEIDGRVTFTDTDDINVQKAAYIGVVSGVGDGAFSPDSPLTREQAATMLARLAVAMGKALPDQSAAFADNGEISTWAVTQVGQIQAAGIMTGTGDNLFSPKEAYSREQCILTILRLYDFVV